MNPTTKSLLRTISTDVALFEGNCVRSGTKVVETFDGPENAFFIIWTNRNESIEFWKIITNEDLEDGWAALYRGAKGFLVVGNYYNHPFVITKDVGFENSDGSTLDDHDPKSMTVDLAKDILIKKSEEYIFRQIH